MKRNLLLPVILLFALFSASAQISPLGTNDFTHAGDTIRVSMATPFTGMDATLTGANYTWDYSQLINTMTGQAIDTFLSVSSTPGFLIYYFSVLYPCNQATYTSTSFLNTLGVPISGTYNFFDNVSASFSQKGIGIVLSGIGVPVAFTSPDVVYKFPLHFGDTDSSTSSYTISNIPGDTTGLYYSSVKTRLNSVDGWGNLTTPYGTFPVLRMQSIIHEHDSIGYLGFNTGIDQPEIIEYKWLGAGMKIPLLQINTTLGIPTSIVYRDSARIALIGVPEISSSSFGFELYPNPSADNITVRYSLAKNSDVLFEILNAEGKIIFSEKLFIQIPGEQKQTLNLKQSLASGNYFLRLTANEKQEVRRLVISK